MYRPNSLGLTIVLSLLAAGCNPQTSRITSDADHDKTARHEHDHPSSGPHGGHLIELGSEQYHAEIKHANEATVYLLDGSAKTAAPIDAAEVVINVAHNGTAEQFRLAANPDAQDPQGKASRFSSNDAELLADLNAGDAKVELVVNVSGKQYRGSLEHHHDHDGHSH
jgi:hypothetical protein